MFGQTHSKHLNGYCLFKHFNSLLSIHVAKHFVLFQSTCNCRHTQCF